MEASFFVTEYLTSMWTKVEVGPDGETRRGWRLGPFSGDA
jgi:hypothetical protein